MTLAGQCPLACGKPYPPVICDLIRQLTHPDVVRQIEVAGNRQVDVTLFASNGRAVLEAEIRAKVKT